MKSTYKNISFLAVIKSILILSFNCYSQNDTVDTYGYSLIELSKLNIVSAKKTLQEYKDVSLDLKIITAREIEEHGYFTLEQALSNLPGFQFRNIQGFNSYIFQRGIPNQNNLILLLVDGVQVNELNSGGFYAGGQYNLDDVERIEVLYGPSSVIYGTNAVSGIVNIITKSSNGASASVLTGNFNTFNSSFKYGNQKKTLKYSFSGMYKTSTKASLAGNENDNSWTEQMENFEDDYSFHIKTGYKSFNAGVYFLNKKSSRTTIYPSVGTIYKESGTLWDIWFANAYIENKLNIAENINLASKIYNRNAVVDKNTIGQIVDTAQIGYYRPNHLLGAESIISYTLNPKLWLIGGLMLETEELAEGFSKTYSSSSQIAPPNPPKPNMLQNKLLSTFLEGEYLILPQLILKGGLRYDNSSVYNQVVTPQTSLTFNIKNYSSRVLYAEAFRAPKPWDYTDGIGNNDLLPEYYSSLGFSNSVYFSNKFIVSLSLYRNHLTHAIEKEVLGDGDNYRWINKSELKTNGVEFAANYSTKKLNLFANYTYNNTFNENIKQVAEIAEHSANTGITLRFENKLRFNFYANYLGKRKNPQWITASYNDVIDPAIIFNGNMHFAANQNLSLHLLSKNLFDAEYYHTSNRLVERYRQSQRTIMLKVTYKFI